ncbi:HprK-related kinase B [Maridesulfovibrio hydrothermalis]|uniref:HPr kinase n=1 Tax=Maridesulfovibrio hydrothermalis AM13 = DSM 14728 TaxID=1121451 RepID=L0RAK1_9BACT|nr:HprK-related kinase B [Maridesulfovibrio hydrothermalis]CCO23803.1 HPr kinase [Maridesulfovibrio hydrothermalis AM13 = DSM 14728]
MNRNHITRADIVRTYRKQFPADKSLFINFGGCVIETKVNSAKLLADLNNYFKEFLIDADRNDILITAHECPAVDLGLNYTVKQPEPGKTKIKEEFADLSDGRVVYKRLTGLIFAFGDDENIAVGPCVENLNQVINFINNRFIEYKLNTGSLLGHAAGVIRNGRAIAIAGFSGMGKSTLALHLMSRGTTFLSNDRVMIEENGKTITLNGVAKHPRINPGTALNNPDLDCIVPEKDKAKFKALPEEELWELEHKYDALIDECFGKNKFILRAPMNGLVILNWQRGQKTTSIQIIDPAQRKDLLPAFMKGTGLFYLPSSPEKENDPDVDAYADILSRTTIIEISGGVDFDKAADACLKFMQEGIIQ